MDITKFKKIIKESVREAIQEVLNEDSGSDSQSVSGFINVYALVPDRFKEIIDKGNKGHYAGYIEYGFECL